MRGHKPHVLGPDTKSLVTLILLRQLGGEQRFAVRHPALYDECHAMSLISRVKDNQTTLC